MPEGVLIYNNVTDDFQIIDNNGCALISVDPLTTSVTNLIDNGDITINANDINNFCVEVTSCINNNSGTQTSIQNLIDQYFSNAPQSLIDSIQQVVIDVFSQDPPPNELVEAVQCILSESIEPINSSTCEELTPLYLGVGADGKKYIRFQESAGSTRLGSLIFDDDDGITNTPPFNDVRPVTYYGSNTPVPVGTSIFNADGTVSNPLNGASPTVRSMGNTAGVEIPTRAQLITALDSSSSTYNASRFGREIQFDLLPNLLTAESEEITLSCNTVLEFELSNLVTLATAGEAPKTGQFHISYTNLDTDGGQWWILSNQASTPQNFNTYTNYVSAPSDTKVATNLPFPAGRYKFAIHPTSEGAFATLAGDALGATVILRINKAIS